MMLQNRALTLSLLFPLATFAAASCGDDRTASPAEDACEHFAEGPIEEVVAGATAAEGAVVDKAHTRWDITLAGVDTHTGFLKIQVGATGEHVFYFDSATTVTLTDSAGQTVAPESSGGSDSDCATIGTFAMYDLSVGSYTMSLATSSDNPLLMVWLAGAHGH